MQSQILIIPYLAKYMGMTESDVRRSLAPQEWGHYFSPDEDGNTKMTDAAKMWRSFCARRKNTPPKKPCSHKAGNGNDSENENNI